jgi:hypothetical protein
MQAGHAPASKTAHGQECRVGAIRSFFRPTSLPVLRKAGSQSPRTIALSAVQVGNAGIELVEGPQQFRALPVVQDPARRVGDVPRRRLGGLSAVLS